MFVGFTKSVFRKYALPIFKKNEPIILDKPSSLEKFIRPQPRHTIRHQYLPHRPFHGSTIKRTSF